MGSEMCIRDSPFPWASHGRLKFLNSHELVVFLNLHESVVLSNLHADNRSVANLHRSHRRKSESACAAPALQENDGRHVRLGKSPTGDEIMLWSHVGKQADEM